MLCPGCDADIDTVHVILFWQFWGITGGTTVKISRDY